MQSDPRRDTLRRFFTGVTEFVFQTRLGVVDPPLLDYLSSLLLRFVHSDQIYSIRNPTGRKLDQVADLLQEAQFRRGEAARQIHRHIGDFTLFWSGVYPEVAERMRSAGRKDALIDYPSQGKRAYYIASTIPAERQLAPSEVLQRLSEQFELCVYGLGEIRREWEARDEGQEPQVIF